MQLSFNLQDCSKSLKIYVRHVSSSPNLTVLCLHKVLIFWQGNKFLRNLHRRFLLFKGQLILKANCQALNSSKKRTNEFILLVCRCVFVCFLEEIEDSKKAFQNYLTFSNSQIYGGEFAKFCGLLRIHILF